MPERESKQAATLTRDVDRIVMSNARSQYLVDIATIVVSMHCSHF